MIATLRALGAALPALRRGLGLTVLLAVIATAGRVVVPIAVQQTVDSGLSGGHVDAGRVHLTVGLCAVGLGVTVVCGYLTNRRLYTATETALSALRIRTFRHIHDLSMLHQASERRGSLVSRVTSDVDQLSTFMQWGGIQLLTSSGQLLVATVLMAVYSWPLTLVVWATFAPLVLALPRFQKLLAAAYAGVRERVGAVLSAVAESVVGAPVIRAYGVQARTQARIDAAVGDQQAAQVRAQALTALTYVSGELCAAAALAGVTVVGVLLGVAGHLSAGHLIAFFFLITLFIAPVQVATEVLNEGQNALAGWRRVQQVLALPADVADPGGPDGTGGSDLPPGPLQVEFAGVTFAYPGGPPVLHGIDVTLAPRTRVAVVGQTGSGKTTLAKLATRLMDPTAGTVRIGGVDLRDVRFASLRSRVSMVPQDGFLLDASVADNVRLGRPGLADAAVEQAFEELGLADWVASLPAGVATRVGERGDSLSVGERQLVAVARAYVASPDLLVLDEATSAVDPATEQRVTRALARLTEGRTTITIAHRLSTAEVADEVVVVDAGEVVQRGPHAALVAQAGSVYAGLHASWVRQRATAGA